MTESDCSVGGDTVTVRVVEPLTEETVALIVVVPTAKLEASPVESRLATLVLDEFQVAALVRSCVVLSLYVPVATNCWALPTSTDGLTGLTAMPVKTAEVTVSTAELLTEPDDAVIVVWPGAIAVARPLVLIVATDGVEELQLTDAVKSCVLPSLNSPAAVDG